MMILEAFYLKYSHVMLYFLLMIVMKYVIFVCLV